MNKQVTVTFEFDPTTEITSNLKCFIDGIEKKKVTTRSQKPKEIILEDEAIVTLEANKIAFNNRCTAQMGLEWQDRVIVKYEKFANVSKPMPIIGKDLSFDQEGSGNKVTKTNTIAYRGKANTILAQYGTEFTLEFYKDGIWKLITKTGGDDTMTYEKVVEQAEEIDVVVITDEGTEEIPINELGFKL